MSLQVKKFFHTESELKIKKRKHTPAIVKFKSIKIPKKAKDNITGMLNEFRERQANTSSGIDYFSENFKVVDLFNDTKITGDRRKTSTTKRSLFSSPKASTSRKDEVSPALLSNKKDETSQKSHTSTSLAKLPTSHVESPAIFKTPANRKTILSSDVQRSANSLVRVTRRTSMLALSSPSVDNTPIQRNQQAIPAEITEITGDDNLTKNTSEPMEITPSVEKSPRVISNRRTNVISTEMDVTNPESTISLTRKRNSIIPMRFKDFEVNTKKYLVKNSPNNSQSEKTIRRRTVFALNDTTSSTTAVSTSNKVDEAQTSHPNRRRTLFAINHTPSNAIDALNQNHEEQASTSNVNQSSVFAPNEASSPLVATKNVASLRRSLFKPPTATLSPLAITALTKVDDMPKSNSKRRRTLLPPQSPSPLAVSTLNTVGEKGDANRRRTVFASHTNPILSTTTPSNNETAKGSNRRRTCFASSQASDHLNTSQGKRNLFVQSFFLLFSIRFWV